MGKKKIEETKNKNNNKNINNNIKNKKFIKKTSVSEQQKSLRKLYNKLMLKDKKDKTEIVKKILLIIEDSYKEFCFKHDGCRILQGCLKYGDKNQKKVIINKLIPFLYEIINGKYSIYLSAKIFKYSDNNQKKKILNEIVIPNFKHLLKYSGGISFVKIMFQNSLKNFQEQLINLYIENYLKIPIDKINMLKNLDDNNETNENNIETNENIIKTSKKNSFELETIKESLKTHIEKQLEQGIHKNFIFQGFLLKIFDNLDSNTQIYLSEVFDDDFLPFLDNNYGLEFLCKLFTVSNSKTRKKIIKKIRENLNENLNNENYYLFITKIILFTDDTVIINKFFMNVIIEKLNENFEKNKNCLKIIYNIFFPFNKKVNNNNENEILCYNKSFSNKKSLEKRKEEIIFYIFDKIYKLIVYEIKFLMFDFLFSNFLTDFMCYLIEKNLIGNFEEILNKIILIIKNDLEENKNNLNECSLVNKISQITIKRIMKILSENKNNEIKKYEKTFYFEISEILKKNLEFFLNSRAVFLIIQIVENNKNLINLDKYKKIIDENKNSNDKNKQGIILLSKLI